MSKRILVISTSLREKSNSQALGDAFAAGAREAGHQVEQISLRGRSIAFCTGCLACLRRTTPSGTSICSPRRRRRMTRSRRGRRAA